MYSEIIGVTVYPFLRNISIIPFFPGKCAAPTAANKLPVFMIESMLLDITSFLSKSMALLYDFGEESMFNVSIKSKSFSRYASRKTSA